VLIGLLRRTPIAERDELLHEGIDQDASGLTLTVKECSPEGGLSAQRIEEIRSALRQLGLEDKIE
jgi:hypothetical protein